MFYRKHWLYPRLNKALHGRVLDMGCGVGDMLAFRPNTIGVDINPHTVEWCCSKGFDAHLMQEDVLPFDDQFFQGMILDNVLEHIKDPIPILSEAYRILDKEGILIIGVPGELGYSMDSDHKVFYSNEKLIETVTPIGFRVQRLFGMPINLAWLGSRIRQYCVYGIFQKA